MKKEITKIVKKCSTFFNITPQAFLVASGGIIVGSVLCIGEKTKSVGKTFLKASLGVLSLGIKQQITMLNKENYEESGHEQKPTDLVSAIQNAPNLDETKLVGDMIGYGQINELWGRSGSHKSFFARQLAWLIASAGKFPCSRDCVSDNTALKPAQHVVYLNLETSEREYGSRYDKDVLKQLNVPFVEEYFFNAKQCTKEQIVQLVKKIAIKTSQDTTIFIDLIAAIPGMSAEVNARFLLDGLTAAQNQAKDRHITITYVLVHQIERLHKNVIVGQNNVQGSKILYDQARNVIVIEPTRFGENKVMVHSIKSKLNANLSIGRLMEVMPTPYTHLKFLRTADIEELCYIQAKKSPSKTEKNEDKYDLVLCRMIDEIDKNGKTQEEVIRNAINNHLLPWKRTIIVGKIREMRERMKEI